MQTQKERKAEEKEFEEENEGCRIHALYPPPLLNKEQD